MSNTVNLYLVWLLAYSAGLIALGIYLSRQIRFVSDFLVAGRRFGPGLIFATFLAANIGAGSTVGAASLGYEFGWSAWWWIGSAGLGSLILANLVGPRIWRLASDQNLHTLGDYLEYRYNRSVRGTVALIIWVGTLLLLAGQLIAISVILNVVIGLPHWQGCILGGMVVVSYFAAGGLLSSAWVNVVELHVLMIGFLIAIPYALDSSGGWNAVTQNISARLGELDGPRFFNPTGFGISRVFYYIALLSPSFIVSPGLIGKIYGARSASAVRRGVTWNGIALLLFATIPTCFGIIAASLFPSLSDSQLAMPKVMMEILPAWLGILGLAAIFSAEISTCDAVLFMLSTSLTIDLYKRFLNPDAKDQTLLRVSRSTSVGAGILGVMLAIQVPSIIESLTVFYGLVSVSLFVPVVVGLYSRRPDSTSALAAITTSVPCTLMLRYFVGEEILGILNPLLSALSFRL